ncbi:MAG: conjugative transposon protein TraK [Paludibacteraceae bacterium]|nr:conjugative transposon protein TraK [Paludibacteraceae bacterium]
MFQSLKNIQHAFALARIYLILITLLALAIAGYAIYASFRFAEAQREKIYVLDQGQSLLMALSNDVSDNRMAEARSHVKRFHEYFFTLSPEKAAIEGNVQQALFLADNSASDVYMRMKEEGFYERIIASSIVCEVQIDSIVIDDSVYPYQVKTYGITSIVRRSNITYRNLETQCSLLNTSRTDNNPHGFLIENWNITDNSDLRTVQR